MPTLPIYSHFWLKQSLVREALTVDSGIDVGPTFINFGLFSRPYGLFREYIKVI